MSATSIASAQLSRAVTADPAGTATDATNGNISVNTGATVFRFHNTDSASHTITFISLPTEDGLALADLVLTIPSSSTQWVSGFDTQTFGSQVTYNTSSAMIVATVFEP